MSKEELIWVIEEQARQLEAWAREVKAGGWSTMHLQPMQEQATRLWAVVGRARAN